MNTIVKERFYDLIGSSIVAKRKKNGLTQIELANKLGMSRTSIVNIENGKQFPPLHLLWEISCILDIELSELVPDKTKISETKVDTSLKKVILNKAKKSEITEESILKIKSFVLND